jgi:hypothetical protein
LKKWQVDKKAPLPKWQVKNIKLTKCQDDEMKWQIYEIAGWQNGNLTKQQLDEVEQQAFKMKTIPLIPAFTLT